MQVSASSVKSTVSGYLSVGEDQSLADCSRRWFELHRDGVLYSFNRLMVINSSPVTRKHEESIPPRKPLVYRPC